MNIVSMMMKDIFQNHFLPRTSRSYSSGSPCGSALVKKITYNVHGRYTPSHVPNPMGSPKRDERIFVFSKYVRRAWRLRGRIRGTTRWAMRGNTFMLNV